MNKNTFSGSLLRVLTIAFLSLYVISCSKEEIIIIPGKSDYNDLTGFTFKRSDNANFTEDCVPHIAGTTFYITVPEGANITLLKPTITASPKATVHINGTLVPATPGSYDFTNTAKVVVTSESGRTKEYKLLVQPGRRSLDLMVYSFMTKYSIPGISIAVSKGEQVVYKSGLGFAIVEEGVRTKPNHLFRLASVSKQFTTMCIMKLLEQGKLTVEDRVFGNGGILAAEFPIVSDRAATVTVRNLLEHNSGWTSNPDPMFTSSFKGQTLDQRISYVLTSSQTIPGTTYSYFNMGFGILGKIIEKLSGKDYEVFLREVMAQAGITEVHVGGDRSQKRPNEVVYYSQGGTNGYGNEMPVIAAAGGVIASTEEMLKLIFHIDGKTTIPDIISPSTRSLMLTPSVAYNRYALGWRTNHTYYPNSWYHGGNLAGTATIWVMGPEYSAVILCNSRSYISGFDDELYGLIKDVLASAAATW